LGRPRESAQLRSSSMLSYMVGVLPYSARASKGSGVAVAVAVGVSDGMGVSVGGTGSVGSGVLVGSGVSVAVGDGVKLAVGSRVVVAVAVGAGAKGSAHPLSSKLTHASEGNCFFIGSFLLLLHLPYRASPVFLHGGLTAQ